MKNLIQQCWNNFQSIKQQPYVVPNSIPILWFGNMNAYRQSDLRIVTVGLNPSNIEFLPQRGSTNYSVVHRFPKAANMVGKKTLSPKDIVDYENSMNDYFTNKLNGKPTWYRTWFSNNEAALHGLDASYFDSSNYKRIAIHIDLCTPIATNKWSSLSATDKLLLQNNVGYSFSQLIKKLDPNVIITSMNRDYIRCNFTETNNAPCEEKNALYKFCKKDSKGRTYSYIRAYRLQGGRILIWGNNGNTPFARLCQNLDIIPQIQKIRKNMQIP